MEGFDVQPQGFRAMAQRPHAFVEQAVGHLRAAQLQQPQPAFVRAVVIDVQFELDDPVRNAVQVLIAIVSRLVVEHEHGATDLGEIAFERQDLAAIAQGILGQQAQLRQAVEHHAPGLERLDEPQHFARGLAQLELRRM